MQYVLTVDTYEELTSFNGGITRSIHRFVDHLAQHGIDELFRTIQEKADLEDKSLKDDFRFLSKGIKTIDKTAFESAVAALQDTWQRMEDLAEEHEQCAESLTLAEAQWRETAERAKDQIEVWEKWANETEREERRNRGGERRVVANALPYFKRFPASPVLDSQEKFHANIQYFEKQFERLEGVLSQAYIAGNLPTDLSCSGLDAVIERLMDSYAKLIELQSADNKVSEKLEVIRKEYVSQEQTLLRLLWQMPESAHWALFRIYESGVLGSGLPNSVNEKSPAS